MPAPRESFPFGEFEPKWQDQWEQARIFHYEPPTVPGTPKWNLMELPPFANGKLHLGHVRNYVMADVSARFRRMCGFLVLYTSGFDSFGLPNELAAFEEGRHPASLAEEVIQQMRGDFRRLGLSHDTRRVIGYHEEIYYRWVQWVFLRLFEHGYAYRQKAPLPWCPRCRCTLADSLCEGGICWRCKQPVETRTIAQWFIKESEFAEELVQSLDSLRGWPLKIRKIHADWIGRREGAMLSFRIDANPVVEFAAFLPNPESLPAIRAVLVSPDHPLLDDLTRAGRIGDQVLERVAEARRSSVAGDHFRALSARAQGDVTGIDLGLLARHPLLDAPVPILVLAELDLRFQEGAMLLCPAHVRADAKIAESLRLPIDPLAAPGASDRATWIARLLETGSGSPAIRYRLRDWNIARQRYWGPPVPIIHCGACGEVGVPDSDLPVQLPADVDLNSPNPLQDHARFRATACPRCGGPAERDTDTLEAYSSPWWYQWNAKGTATENPFDLAESRATLPVDLMIGGDDQARSCFFHIRMMARALHRIGIVEDPEPVQRLVAIGMVKSQGRKMSKSEGNAVDPFQLVASYGADSLRLAMMAAGAPDSDINWDDAMVSRAHSFLHSVWRFFEHNREALVFSKVEEGAVMDTTYSMSAKLAHQVSIAASRITEALENQHFHLAATNVMQLFERLESYEQEAVKRRKRLDARDCQALTVASRIFLRMLTPLCPHIAEELSRGADFAAQAAWPATLKNEAREGDRHAPVTASGGSGR